MRLLVEHGAAHLGDLGTAEVTHERERVARVGDVVDHQHARRFEIDEVEWWGEDDREVEALVDARVVLDVDDVKVLHAERVGDRARR